jgi:hypothetical protein
MTSTTPSASVARACRTTASPPARRVESLLGQPATPLFALPSSSPALSGHSSNNRAVRSAASIDADDALDIDFLAFEFADRFSCL